MVFSLRLKRFVRGLGIEMFASVALWVLVAMTDAAAQSTVPVLRYTPPANAFQAGTGSPDDYAFNGFNASVQVYPFRPFTGNIQQAFQMTLLRDWIALQYQEQNPGEPPQFGIGAVAGADRVIIAQFVEIGYFRLRSRMLIVVENQAAIIDVSAGTEQSSNAAIPFVNAMVASMSVEASCAPTPLTTEAGCGVAGYMGMAPKGMSYLNAVGTRTISAKSFYLFSAMRREL